MNDIYETVDLSMTTYKINGNEVFCNLDKFLFKFFFSNNTNNFCINFHSFYIFRQILKNNYLQ